MRIAPWCVWLTACGAMPNDITLIDDVRLIAAIADPPSAAVGETYTLTAIIADREERPVDVVIWWCLPEELGPCEVQTPDLVGDEAVATLTAGLPVPVFIVACADGSCADPSEDDLRDPYGWLQRLPLEGVTAGTRTVRVTELPPEKRPGNPVITEAPAGPLTAAPEEALSLRFVAPGAFIASGITSAGAFGAINTNVAEDGSVDLTWFAPTDEGDARLYVVVDDGAGGAAVWRGSVAVSSPAGG